MRAARMLGPSAVLFLAALTLYLSTLSRHYSADSLLYAGAIESGSWRDLIHPHHLALHPLGWIWFRLWQALRWRGSAIVPLEVLNAVGGAACVGLFLALAARTSGSLVAAILSATGFAVSGGVWLLSTEAEFVTVPLALELLVLSRVLRREAASPWRVVGLGAGIGGAVLAYLTSAALLPVAWLALGHNPQVRHQLWRTRALLLAGFALLIAPAALCATAIITGLRHWPAMLAVLSGGGRYGVLSWETLPRGLYAFLRTLVLFPGLGMNDRTLSFFGSAGAGERAVFVATYITTGLAAVAPLVLAFQRRLRGPLEREISLWVALHAAFAFYWVPSDTSFWLPVTVAWWLLVTTLIAKRNIAPAVAAAGVVVLLLANGFGLILPHHLAEHAKPPVSGGVIASGTVLGSAREQSRTGRWRPPSSRSPARLQRHHHAVARQHGRPGTRRAAGSGLAQAAPCIVHPQRDMGLAR